MVDSSEQWDKFNEVMYDYVSSELTTLIEDAIMFAEYELQMDVEVQRDECRELVAEYVSQALDQEHRSK
jgi:hypothetical protein